MQSSGTARPPIGIVYDSDLGNRVEPLLGLAVMYGLDAKNEARVVQVSVSTGDLNAAAYCAAVGSFYAAGGFSRTLPVGLAGNSRKPETPGMLAEPLARKAPDGQPVYRHDIHTLNDTAEPGPVIRNAFTAQHDGNCVVVLAGPATNLAAVLAVRGAADVIANKVKMLVVSAGSYTDGPPDANILADVPAARKLFSEWPGPIVAVGEDIGTEVMFPGASFETDFSWTQAHPIVDAYRAAGKMPYDTSTRDMAAVLYAIRPQEGYFKVSEPGTITIADDGRSEFSPTADGRHRRLIFDPGQKERLLKTYIELASTKPVPKRRPRPPQVDEKKPDPAKPPAAERP